MSWPRLLRGSGADGATRRTVGDHAGDQGLIGLAGVFLTNAPQHTSQANCHPLSLEKIARSLPLLAPGRSPKVGRAIMYLLVRSAMSLKR